jgi:toxin YoeB
MISATPTIRYGPDYNFIEGRFKDERAWEDYLHWRASDPKLLARLNVLIKECARTPFQGTGKSEPLRGPVSGWWSPRLTQEHRLV